ncbi:hypothetical protein C8F04DRAFT_1329178 [Mycena alexandri]|uniref:Uncharacterized protein n=1 Tax=Mycena alexandri TaxID=1745969 RepID=A0AAD6S3E8_9AGAR|nr:hypothetical protein C8F04DRAFT_1329178 [Mycena alexandri]
MSESEHSQNSRQAALKQPGASKSKKTSDRSRSASAENILESRSRRSHTRSSAIMPNDGDLPVAAESLLNQPQSSPLPPLTPSFSEKLSSERLSPMDNIYTSGVLDNHTQSDRTSRYSKLDSHRSKEKNSEYGKHSKNEKQKGRAEVATPTSKSRPSHSSRTSRSSDTSELDERERETRRNEKRRRTRADSDESDDVKEATRRSKLAMISEWSSGEENGSHLYADTNLRAAHNELNRERGSQESMTEYQRRLEAGKRSARISREWRESCEQADREYTMKLQAEYDRVEAERVADELRMADETRELERQREELEKTKKKLRKIHRRKEKGGESPSKVSRLDISNETPPPPSAQSTSAFE